MSDNPESPVNKSAETARESLARELIPFVTAFQFVREDDTPIRQSTGGLRDDLLTHFGATFVNSADMQLALNEGLEKLHDRPATLTATEVTLVLMATLGVARAMSNTLRQTTPFQE